MLVLECLKLLFWWFVISLVVAFLLGEIIHRSNPVEEVPMKLQARRLPMWRIKLGQLVRRFGNWLAEVQVP